MIKNRCLLQIVTVIMAIMIHGSEAFATDYNPGFDRDNFSDPFEGEENENEYCVINSLQCINTIWGNTSSPTMGSFTQEFLDAIGRGDITDRDAANIAKIAPYGFRQPFVRANEQNYSWVMGGLAYTMRLAIDEGLGKVKIVGRGGGLAGSIISGVGKDILNEVWGTRTNMAKGYAYGSVRDASRYVLGRAEKLFSKEEILEKSPEAMAYVYNEILDLHKENWGQFSTAEKEGFVLSMFTIVGHRLTQLEKDSSLFGKWRTEFTSAPEAVPYEDMSAPLNDLSAWAYSAIQDGTLGLNLNSDLIVALEVDNYSTILGGAVDDSLQVAQGSGSNAEKAEIITRNYKRAYKTLVDLEADVQGLVVLLSLVDPESARLLDTGYRSVMMMSSGITNILASGAGGSMLGGMGMIANGLMIFQSLGAPGQGDITGQALRAILDMLSVISKQIRNLEVTLKAHMENTGNQFAALNTKLDSYHIEIMKEFSRVNRSLQSLKNQHGVLRDRVDLKLNSILNNQKLAREKEYKDILTKIWEHPHKGYSVTAEMIGEFHRELITNMFSSYAPARFSWLGPRDGFDSTEVLSNLREFNSVRSENIVPYEADFLAGTAGNYYNKSIHKKDSIISTINPYKWAEAAYPLMQSMAQSKLMGIDIDTYMYKGNSFRRYFDFASRDMFNMGYEIAYASYVLQNSPEFFKSLLDDYRASFNKGINDIGIRLNNKMLGQYQNREFITSRYSDFWLSQQKLTPGYMPTLAAGASNTAIQVLVQSRQNTNYGKGLSYSMPDVDGVDPESYFGGVEKYPAILWPTWDIDSILASSSPKIIPTFAMDLVALGYGRIDQTYRIEDGKNYGGSRSSFKVVHSAEFVPIDRTGILFDRFFIGNIEVSYDCKIFKNKIFTKLSDVSSCKKVSSFEISDTEEYKLKYHSILKDSFNTEALQVMKDVDFEGALNNFYLASLKLRTFYHLAFPVSSSEITPLAYRVIDPQSHPLGIFDEANSNEYTTVALVGTLIDKISGYDVSYMLKDPTLFSQEVSNTFEKHTRYSHKAIDHLWFELDRRFKDNQSRLESMGYSSFDDGDYELWRAEMPNAPYSNGGRVYEKYRRMIDLGFEVDSRISAPMEFFAIYLKLRDVANDGYRNSADTCSNFYGEGDSYFRIIKNGTTKLECQDSGKFETKSTNCDDGYYFDSENEECRPYECTSNDGDIMFTGDISFDTSTKRRGYCDPYFGFEEDEYSICDANQSFWPFYYGCGLKRCSHEGAWYSHGDEIEIEVEEDSDSEEPQKITFKSTCSNGVWESQRQCGEGQMLVRDNSSDPSLAKCVDVTCGMDGDPRGILKVGETRKITASYDRCEEEIEVYRCTSSRDFLLIDSYTRVHTPECR